MALGRKIGSDFLQQFQNISVRPGAQVRIAHKHVQIMCLCICSVSLASMLAMCLLSSFLSLCLCISSLSLSLMAFGIMCHGPVCPDLCCCFCRLRFVSLFLGTNWPVFQNALDQNLPRDFWIQSGTENLDCHCPASAQTLTTINSAKSAFPNHFQQFVSFPPVCLVDGK